MQCTNPVRITPKKNHSGSSIVQALGIGDSLDSLIVPCGRCLACRIARRREWSMRMLHELDTHENSVFLTLTYQDRFLPAPFFHDERGITIHGCSLLKSDLQKFFKRLRKRLSEDGRCIKYFACGEYGDKTGRPHYHAIVFGLSLDSDDKTLVMDSWPYADWSVPAIRRNAFGLAEPESIQYVAQYIDKKFSGPEAEKEYNMLGREPVFRLLSNGLGLGFCLKNRDQLVSNGSVRYRGCDVNLPRYYLDKLGIKADKDKGIEQDCSVVNHYTGLWMTDDDAYRSLKPFEYMKYHEKRQKGREQHSRNLKAKSSLRERD